MNMNTRNTLATAAVLAAALISGAAFAHGGTVAEPLALNQEADGPLVYTNAAYTRAISGAPNPAPETAPPEARLIYVDQAYGPAIHSYPGR